MNAADEPARLAHWLDRALDAAILQCDHAGRVVVTYGPDELFPAAYDSLIGSDVADLETLPVAMRQAWRATFELAFDTQRAQICAYEIDRGTGTRSFEARMVPLDADSVVVAIRDVGERNQLRAHAEHCALHDELTGLGNTRSLRERLQDWMRPGVPVDRAAVVPVALLIIDLDRFKRTNDLQGHSIGDSLLRLVAQRIRRETLRELVGQAYEADDAGNPNGVDERDDPQTTPALSIVRVGGDVFAVAWRMTDRPSILIADGGAARCEALADRLIVALSKPTRIAGETLFVRASVGAALFPGDALLPSALFSQAEGALKRAKRAGRNQARRHGDDADARAGPPLSNDEAALRAAVASNHFELVYRPKLELATSLLDKAGPGGERGAFVPGVVVAVEALVRWRTPDGTLLMPHQFLPLAEASGVIRPLGDWVLRTALDEVRGIAALGTTRVGVAINVSAQQLHDRTFVETVEAALRESGFAADELTIEIAETAFTEDIRLIEDAVGELSALGVRLAIDHFGVGTAGLVALKALPVDEIKIDRSFIAGAAIDAFDTTIVRGLIEMAHTLGKTVTAEGVERVDQVASLGQMRCDAIQGGLIGEPMSAAALVAAPPSWLKTPRVAS